MHIYAKYMYLMAFLCLSSFLYFHFQDPKTPTLDSLRVEAQEARSREIQAQKDREIREDSLSQALYDRCYSEAITESGSRFEQKQKRAYDCWRKNTNSGTVASASSEVPQGGIILSTQTIYGITHEPPIVNTNQKPQNKNSTVLIAVKSDTKEARNKKPSQSISGKSTNAKTVVNSSNTEKYWIAYEVAVSQIKKWEGLRLKAYWDFSHCSIGYGFSSACGKSITQKQADQMLSDRVKEKLQSVQKDFPRLSPEAQGTLVSFAHNCPAGYADLVSHGLNRHSLWCKTAGGKRLSGLVKRRIEEAHILFSK